MQQTTLKQIEAIMEVDFCPKCSESISNITANDGGSKYCSECKLTFHWCNDIVRYGSPGPSMCQYCKGKKR